MHSPMHTFDVPMHRAVSIAFMLCVTVVASVVVWCFRSGLFWSAVCTIAVAAPLTLMYWYMLLVNPARAHLSVGEQGLAVTAPPFIDAAITPEQVVHVFAGELGSDELNIRKVERGMRFGKYRNGRFTLADGRTALILTNSDRVLGVQTGEALYLLGPSGFDTFAEKARALLG